jgi:hypothetical protein
VHGEGHEGRVPLISALALAGVLATAAPAIAHAAAPLPPEPFVVNSFTTGTQLLPAVRSLSDGRFVVAWSSASQDGFGLGVFARLFDATGTAAGTELQVNEFTTGYQLAPAIAALDEGFVVAWQSGPTLFCCTQDGSGFGVFARVFDGDAAALTGEIQANLYTIDNPANPSVAPTAGGFVVAWDSNEQDPDGVGVYARMFDATGTAVTEEIAVADLTAGDQLRPAVADGGDGGFVVAWRDTLGLDQPVDVRARAFDAAGAPLSASVLVSPDVPVERRLPLLARGPGGELLSVWSARNDGDDFGVFARPLDAAALPLADARQINSFLVNRQFATSVSAADDAFVVVWDSLRQDGSSEGVFARRVNAAAEPLGPEFRINAYTTGEQTQGAVTGLADGTFVVAWTSVGDGDEYGILAARFSAGHALATCGDADAGGEITARDALLALAAATGTRACPPARCDADADGEVSAADALAILRAAVGLDAELSCAA